MNAATLQPVLSRRGFIFGDGAAAAVVAVEASHVNGPVRGGNLSLAASVAFIWALVGA